MRRVRSRACRAASRARRFDRLGDDLLHHRRILVEVFAQLLVDQLDHITRDIGIQLALGLPFELRLRQLNANHRRQALAHVVARKIFFLVLEQARLLRRGVDGPGQRAPETAQMRAAIHRVDVVGKAEYVFRIGVVVLQRHFDIHAPAVRQLALAFEVNRLLMQYRFPTVQMLDEFGNAAAVVKLFRPEVFTALVRQGDLQSLVEEGQLA